MHAGEMVGKMSKEKEKDDDESDSNDENGKAKKGLQGKFALESFWGARFRWYFRLNIKTYKKYTSMNKINLKWRMRL